MARAVARVVSAVRAAAWVGALWACTASGAGPQPAPGWTVTVVAEGLPRIDNLALDDDGTLYATLELADGAGRIVRLRGARTETVLDALHRPDGLIARAGVLYFTEEVRRGRVSRLNLADGSRRVLIHLPMPEGIDFAPQGGLFIGEDVYGGRILHLSEDGVARTLHSGLSWPEGLRVGPDGAIYVAETGTGRVLRLPIEGGEPIPVVSGLRSPDQLAFDAEGALWITEDTNPGRMLRLRAGRLKTIVSGLASPQGMVFGRDGTLYLAEQDRGRILAVRRRTPRPPTERTNPAATQ